jgi:hypothetical protein
VPRFLFARAISTSSKVRDEMAILSTDSVFKKKVKKVVQADREDLWRELHEIAVFFALIGAIQEALAVWKFTYSGMVPMPDPEDRTISVFGDGAISAVCYRLNLPDISNGSPAPQFSGRGTTKPTVVGKLNKRVAALDRISRQRITEDAWCGCNWVDNPQPEQMTISIIRSVRLLAQPVPGDKYSPSELEAYSVLTRLLDANPTLETLHSCYQAEAFLLAADIAARHKKVEEAVKFIQKWHDCSINWDYNIGEVFGLLSVAGLICDGALASKHNLSEVARQEIVRTLVKDLSKRLRAPETDKAPTWKHKISVSYGQFYLEPLKSDPKAVYFQESGESEQGFSSFPRQVAIGIPSDAES